MNLTYFAAIRIADTKRRRVARMWAARAEVIRAQLVAQRGMAW